MSRRSTRKATRVSYAELLGDEDTQPKPSSSKRKGKRKAPEDSDFEDPKVEDEEEIDEVEEVSDTSSPPTPVSDPSNSEPELDQSHTPAKSKQKSIPLAISKPPRRGSSRDANIRARPGPAFFPNPAVRLAPGSRARGLFVKQEIVAEEGERDLNGTKKTRDKLGMNVGAGPVLDMCEDLGWFKEAEVGGTERRPRVYNDVRIKAEDWTTVLESEAEFYISSGLPACPNMTCLMGPFQEQQSVQLDRFETCSLDKYWPTSRALVFNAGNPVWGLDWCSNTESFSAKHNYAQYLALSTIPSSPAPPPPSPPPQPSKSAIQIWRFGSSKSPTNKSDLGTASCSLVLCLDMPPARVLKWCPLPSDDSDEDVNKDETRKLGILAGIFGDGSLVIYAVPEPGSFGAEPAYIRPSHPLVRISLPDARFTCLDWANSEVVAMGCSNGHVAVYNLKSTITPEKTPPGLPLLPTHYISLHQSRVSSVRWIRIPSPGHEHEDPTTLVSGGFDGHVYAVDVRWPTGVGVSMFRCRDVIQSLAFTSYGAGVISNEHENMVKFTGIQPTVLGRGHSVTEVRGPVWDIATSDLHPQVAVASSDGTLTITNLLKYMRKGSPMPSFIHTAYRMDYNPQTKQLRMLDMILPREYKDPRFLSKTRGLPQGVAPPDATPAQRAAAERERDGFGTWALEVGVHCASWQPSRLAQAGVLASGGASGLVRIDVLKELLFRLGMDQNENSEGEEAEDDE